MCGCAGSAHSAFGAVTRSDVGSRLTTDEDVVLIRWVNSRRATRGGLTGSNLFAQRDVVSDSLLRRVAPRGLLVDKGVAGAKNRTLRYRLRRLESNISRRVVRDVPMANFVVHDGIIPNVIGSRRHIVVALAHPYAVDRGGD